MGGHYQCIRISVLVFAALEILGGLIFIGLGATVLVAANSSSDKSSYDRSSNYDDYSLTEDQARTIVHVAGVILIIQGVWCLINGIVGVVGASKHHRCLLIFHAVVLVLGLIGACYLTFSLASIQNVALLIISAIRIGLVIYLLHLLNHRNSGLRHQPKNAAV